MCLLFALVMAGVHALAHCSGQARPHSAQFALVVSFALLVRVYFALEHSILVGYGIGVDVLEVPRKLFFLFSVRDQHDLFMLLRAAQFTSLIQFHIIVIEHDRELLLVR